ncbi:hypothetical protein [Mucilaginibacter terrae]|nr:hypothetical protein [Mucilaginibacter terrae]
MPALLDTTGLWKYPKFKDIVTDLPGFLKKYPNVLKAIAYYTGFSEAQVKQMMQPGKGPKVVVVHNLVDGYGLPVLGHYYPVTRTPQIRESYVLGLDAANLPKVYQATGLLLAITTFHEFVHYGRDVNRLSYLYYDPETHNSGEAGTFFEMNINPYGNDMGANNAIQWIKFYLYNF